MKWDVYVVSAFSKNGSGGNKAGVVFIDTPLLTQQKLKMAHTLGFSETVFVSKSSIADFNLEYFTPQEEVPLCGHATIGTFIVLKHLCLLHQSTLTIETKSGVLDINIDENNFIFMEQTLPHFYETLCSADITHCFDGVSLNQMFPIQMVSTGLKDILLPIDTPTTLHAMTPHFTNIATVSQTHNCIGIHAFSLTNTDNITAICRNFAPLYGINEESATGTSNCALACYLFQHGIKLPLYVFEQGHQLNSISQICVRLDSIDDTITKVFVGGTGYLIEQRSVSI